MNFDFSPLRKRLGISGRVSTSQNSQTSLDNTERNTDAIKENLKDKIRQLTCSYINSKRYAQLRDIREYIIKTLKEDFPQIEKYQWIDESIKQTCINYCSRKYNTTYQVVNKYNCLFAVNNNRITDDSILELYEPSKHGYWDIDETTGKPYLKKPPVKREYLKWLVHLYSNKWHESKESLRETINNLKEDIMSYIENSQFNKDSYRKLTSNIPYFSVRIISPNISRLFKENSLKEIVNTVINTNKNNYEISIRNFTSQVRRLQREGYGNINSFITLIAHVINPEFYIPISDDIGTVVVKKWWKEITEEVNPNYSGNKERCVGQDSRNLQCLEQFLIELNKLRIDLGIESMMEIAFLLNSRKKDENDCSERRRLSSNNVNFEAFTENQEITTEISISENSLTFPCNTIFYGPPGTGKTYSVRKRAVEIIKKGEVKDVTSEFRKLLFTSPKDKNWKIAFVTFHPSTSYETFMEGIWAETDEEGNIHYEVKDGIFKIATYHALWYALDKEIRKNGFTDYRDLKRTVQKYLNKHFRGESYFNFNEAENVVLIIDEINRGNIPSIFGELITLIEETKRLGSEEEMSLILPYSREIFSVPKNLYIIGTMNTADRSIVLLDAALRRRFNFEEFLPDTSLLYDIRVGNLNIGKFLEKLNKKIKERKGKDFTIGHAYFLPLKRTPQNMKLEELITILANKVLPLLQEYFYDDWSSLIEILGGNEEIENYIIDEYGEIKFLDMKENKERVLSILERFTSDTANPQSNPNKEQNETSRSL